MDAEVVHLCSCVVEVPSQVAYSFACPYPSASALAGVLAGPGVPVGGIGGKLEQLVVHLVVGYESALAGTSHSDYRPVGDVALVDLDQGSRL